MSEKIARTRFFRMCHGMYLDEPEMVHYQPLYIGRVLMVCNAVSCASVMTSMRKHLSRPEQDHHGLSDIHLASSGAAGRTGFWHSIFAEHQTRSVIAI
jgi:hypothetical protein